MAMIVKKDIVLDMTKDDVNDTSRPADATLKNTVLVCPTCGRRKYKHYYVNVYDASGNTKK